MHSLVYRSVAKDGFGVAEIYSMLSKAKNYNADNNITGCLLYHDHQFLQLLEGEERTVINLYQRILLDDRHQDVLLIESESNSQRIFKEWSMAFYDYGQNGLSANLKSNQIEKILQEAGAFGKNSSSVLKFFSSVKEILFKQ